MNKRNFLAAAAVAGVLTVTSAPALAKTSAGVLRCSRWPGPSKKAIVARLMRHLTR